MKLNLIGHNYKYAVEQIMLALFPSERPVYDEVEESGYKPDALITPLTPAASTVPAAAPASASAAPAAAPAVSAAPDMPAESTAPAVSDAMNGSYYAESRLSMSKVYAQASTTIRNNGKLTRGIARVQVSKLTDKLLKDRYLQRIIKQSFYKAALPYLDKAPVWGSLTGIRPASLVYPLLQSGKTEQQAAQILSDEYYVAPLRAKLCTSAALSAEHLKGSLDTTSIALYVGIPFCPSRCTYCSFVSNSVEKSFEMTQPFVEALLQEIDTVSKIVNEQKLKLISIYIGGGTPTSISANSLASILEALQNSFNFSHLREFTVEAGRPETIDQEKLDMILASGAKRICINPQTMSSAVLSAIGRRHSPEDVFKAVELVKKSALQINMDLIAGLPEDTTAGFINSLNTLVDMAPENITIHTLSLKKGSRIMLEGTTIPNGEIVGEMLDYATFRLYESGYSPYYLYRQKYTSGGFENIGWSLPGHESIYNISMMEDLCTVIGLGGGAVTKLVSPQGKIHRIYNPKYPKEYINSYDSKIPMKTEKIVEFFEQLIMNDE
ncbi:MAG: coproporphyrinogen dehydrogenase HemZ [Oscillospiraceae bacterium]|nr:coproporphyrinogen dehydrogenase HemZ [Oscillospiraceae bacterium]